MHSQHRPTSQAKQLLYLSPERGGGGAFLSNGENPAKNSRGAVSAVEYGASGIARSAAAKATTGF